MSRDRDKVHVEANVIEDLFTTFFLNYAPDVPILDPLQSPNKYYSRSPLLFWAILTVASRRYAADPSLLLSLSNATFQFALQQIDSPAADIHTVEALVLLLSWQFPSTQQHEESGYVMSGALIHLAFKYGLHTAESSQDFVRVKLNLSECEVRRRRQLWAACIVVYQENSAMIGNACLQIPAPLICKEIIRLKCQEPILRLHLQGIITRANNAFDENGFAIETAGEERTLNILIRAYEDEIKMAESHYQNLTMKEKLYVYFAHLQIQAMNFFKPPDKIDNVSLGRLYSVATSLVESVAELEMDTDFIRYSTAYLMRSMALATCILLRLIKTPFVEFINADEAKSLFLTALQLMQKFSVANNDAPARCATAVSRLWRSDRVFKNPDGSHNLRLRVRTRYGMSLMWDCMWWCREEFMGQEGAYSRLPPSESNMTDTQQAAAARPQQLSEQATAEPSPSQQVPLSFDWSMDDWFFNPDLNMQDGQWDVPINLMDSVDPVPALKLTILP
ncbi:hypothetical protein NA57DRAFT_70314 [Rhizodiscina lignyota]|uniref:Xylanolytic transcriptional activator regulatory domain-containing protein n=1 Tax=Rhizodiscina lignyota TaxID=1504668 RepID=A0A9P4ITP9_9PEZI|nr:hypothetical protein NA57DRAFT_70314 [Rhizodiscina lignyota]